jgi:hypothetical protein
MIVHIIFMRGGDDRIVVVENKGREKMIDRLIDGGEDGG